MSYIEDLEKLQKLKENGTITEKEFEKEKYKILNNVNINNDTNSPKTEGIYVVSLLLSIITFLISGIPILGLIISIISLVIVIISKKKLKQINKKKGIVTAGLILSILALIIALIMTFIPLGIMFYNSQQSSDIVNSIVSAETESEIPSTESLLEQIYEKYPQYKDRELFIYGDETEYWLLDEDGKKIRFNDLEGFEKALIECNENIEENEIEVSNNENMPITVPKLIGKTEEEAINILKANNIPYKVVFYEELSYEEGIVVDQTTKIEWIGEVGEGIPISTYEINPRRNIYNKCL